CHHVPRHLVQRGQGDLGHVQADELGVKRGSTPAEKFVYTSSCQRLACLGPLERLRPSSVEVLDEVDQRLMQLLDGVETGAFEQAPNRDAKPNLDLSEPGGMLGGIDKADPVVRIG